MPEPLRLYRWEDAPPELQALSDHGGGEVLVCVAHHRRGRTRMTCCCGCRTSCGCCWRRTPCWTGRPLRAPGVPVQRVPLADGSVCVIVARP